MAVASVRDVVQGADDEREDGPREEGLEVVDPPLDGDPGGLDHRLDRNEAGPGSDPASEAGPTVAALLLAAGRSTRFEGGNKLLADLDGRPVVAHALESLLSAGLPTVVVLGHEADRVAETVRAVEGGGRLAIAGNPDYGRGRGTSVRTGIRSVWRADAALIALGDVPRVSPATVRDLVAAYRAGAGTALAAACEGRRGNPVLFDARHFPALLDRSAGAGGREVLRSAGDGALVETGDPGVLRDVDTRADLDRLR